MKNRLPILVLLWFFIVVTFAAFATSCSTYQVVLESNEDPLVTQNMQNIMELIRTCEEMKEQFEVDRENGCANEEEFDKYIAEVEYMRYVLWELAYVDYIIHESTE